MKAEFTTYPFERCENGLQVEGIEIESLTDILVNKIAALTDRRDPKDFVDLYFALRENPVIDLENLIRLAEIKFGIKGIKHVIRGRFLEGPPQLGTLMMRKNLDPEDLTAFFTLQAKKCIAQAVEFET